MKSLHEYLNGDDSIEQYLLEHGNAISEELSTITNSVIDSDHYKKVKEICDAASTHYVSEYNNSSKLLTILRDLGLLDQDGGMGGTLYNSGGKGVLTYWLMFKDMRNLLRFLVTFDSWAEKFTYDKVHDGNWHMSFDIHDDPLIGLEDGSVTYILQYKSSTTSLSEIDTAVDSMCDKVIKYWRK